MEPARSGTSAQLELPGERRRVTEGESGGLSKAPPKQVSSVASFQENRPVKRLCGSVFCGQSTRVQPTGGVGGSVAEFAFFPVGPSSATQPHGPHGKLANVVEVQLKRYLLDRCSDGKSASRRFLESLAAMSSLLLAIPLCTFVLCGTLPLASPGDGFWANWAFNFLAHPILNYVMARGQLAVMARAFSQEDRRRIRWINRLVPLVDPALCLLLHLLLSLADVYPIPAAPVLSCIPALIGSMVCYLRMLPRDLLTPEARSFMKFTFVNWGFWVAQFATMLLWVARFPLMPEHWQAMSTLGNGVLVFFAGWLAQKIADRFSVPKYLLVEVKLAAFFLGLFFSASLMSTAKSLRVVLLITLLDAGKAVVLSAKLLWELIQACPAEDCLYRSSSELDPSDIGVSEAEAAPTCCSTIRAAIGALVQKVAAARSVGRRLRGLFQQTESQTQSEMSSSDISPGNAQLLKVLTHSWVALAVMELCEVLAPIFYMMLAMLLHSDFAQNRAFFRHFRQETPAQFHDGMVNNTIAVAIEVIVQLGLQTWLLRMFGINLFEFTGAILRLDYTCYVFGMSCCCIVWLAVTIEHFGTWGILETLSS